MNSSFYILAVSMIGSATPLFAQVAEPLPSDAPSTGIMASCTAQVGQRYAALSPADQKKLTLAEMVKTCAINRDFSTYALAQDNKITGDQRARAQTIAQNKAKYAAEKAAWEANVQKQKDDYAASYAQWEADVAACNQGDSSKCQPGSKY